MTSIPPQAPTNLPSLNSILQQGIEGRATRLGERDASSPISPLAPTSTPGRPGGLSDIGGLLSELRSLVADTRDTGQGNIDAARAGIDRVLQDIEGVLDTRRAIALPGASPIVVRDASDGVNVLDVFGLSEGLPPGGLTVDINIDDPGESGSLFLQIAGPSIDLGAADEEFVISIFGSAGARELSFSSGTAVRDIIDAINSFSEQTGVEASIVSVEGRGEFLQVESTIRGDEQFAGINILDSGGIKNARIFDSVNGQPNEPAGKGTDLREVVNSPFIDSGVDPVVSIDGFFTESQAGTFRVFEFIGNAFFDFALDFDEIDPTQPLQISFSQQTITGPDDVGAPLRSPLRGIVDGVLSGERDLEDLDRAIERLLERVGKDQPGAVLDGRA